MVCNVCKIFLELGLRILVNEPSVGEMPLSSTVGPAFGLRMMEMGDRVPKGSPGLSLALHLGCLHLLGPVRAGQAAGTAENGVLPVAEREGLSHKGQASLDPFPVCQSCFKALGVKRLGEEACPRRDSGCSRGGLAGGTPASLHQKSRPHTTQPGQAGGGGQGLRVPSCLQAREHL